MFQRIAMLISLTTFTACAGGMQSQNGLHQHQRGLGGVCELAVAGAVVDDALGRPNRSPNRRASDRPASDSTPNGVLLVGAGVVALGGLIWLVMSDDGDAPKAPAAPFEPTHNVDAPDFVQAAFNPHL